MEQAHKARARKQDAAWENAVLKAKPLHRRDKAAREKAGDQARAPAGVKAEAPDRVKAEAPDRVAVGNLNSLPNQPFN